MTILPVNFGQKVRLDTGNFGEAEVDQAQQSSAQVETSWMSSVDFVFLIFGRFFLGVASTNG